MSRHTHNIHERFLRHIWSKQYLTIPLRTADGKPLTVLDTGQLNSDGGPDFHNAKIKINGVTYAGDVEIHRTVLDWLKHQHQEDPRYNKVILHVVLEAGNDAPPILAHSGRQIPLLVLGQFLSDSIQTIWQKAILDERAKKSETIPCFGKNRAVTAEAIDHWLVKLAAERLELKLRRFDERLKQLALERHMSLREWQRSYGTPPFEGEHNEIPPPFPELTQKDFSNKELWEQVLYEGAMEGLGYSKNREPFLRLARNMTLNIIGGFERQISDMTIESVMFGAADLLPKSKRLKEKEARQYVIKLRKRWKELRLQYHGELLHDADWQYFPARPSNVPTIRLAAACLLIKEFLVNDFFRCTIQILKSNCSGTEKEHRLVQLFNIETTNFWKHHYSFDTPTSMNVTALGASRIRDIVVNAVLPIALLYARIFKDKSVREGALDVYRFVPPSENNSVTRLMESQLLKGRLSLSSVSRQQAIIQLYKYYCVEKRCSDCELSAILSG